MAHAKRIKIPSTKRWLVGGSAALLVLGAGGGLTPRRVPDRLFYLAGAAHRRSPLRASHHGRSVGLQAVEAGGEASLAGNAHLNYNASAETLTVRVDANGFLPNTDHAAPIHSGSCDVQGAVIVMLTDLHAGQNGQIHQTDVVRNLATFTAPSAGWYVNIHEGTSAIILNAAGQPTPQFRPLLCANLPASPSRSAAQRGQSQNGTPAGAGAEPGTTMTGGPNPAASAPTTASSGATSPSNMGGSPSNNGGNSSSMGESATSGNGKNGWVAGRNVVERQRVHPGTLLGIGRGPDDLVLRRQCDQFRLFRLSTERHLRRRTGAQRHAASHGSEYGRRRLDGHP